MAAGVPVAALALLGAAPAAKPASDKPGAARSQAAVSAPRIEPLPPPTYLPALARAALKQRMERHGADMVQLLVSVTQLQHDAAATVADRIAAEPTLAKPIPGDDALNAALPKRFFTLQSDLRERAKAVAKAAKEKDDAALGTAFGRLAETCVSCHSAYLRPAKE